MPNPSTDPRPVARLASNNKVRPEREALNLTWQRPPGRRLESSMLQNRKLDITKVKRSVGKRP